MAFEDIFNRRNIAKKFDAMSGNLFIFGMVSGHIDIIDLPPPGPIAIQMISMIAYLIGYGLWFAASLLHHEYARAPDSWLGFTSFREQYQVSAIIGITASIIWFFFPAIIVPAAWLFLLSNLIWCISEHHKHVNPPPEYNTPDTKPHFVIGQSLYCNYTTIVTIVSLVTALALTLSVIFPPAAGTILLISGVVGGIGTVISFAFLLKSYYKSASRPQEIIVPQPGNETGDPNNFPNSPTPTTRPSRQFPDVVEKDNLVGPANSDSESDNKFRI